MTTVDDANLEYNYEKEFNHTILFILPYYF